MTRGIVLRCGVAGEVREVVRDEFALALCPGTGLVACLEHGNATKAEAFLRRVREDRTALGWELALATPTGPVTLSFTGVATSAEELLLVGTDALAAPSALLDDLGAAMAELAGAERETSRREQVLAHLMVEKNRFLGMCAHDLRNPIGALVGYVEYLLEDDDLAAAERREVLGLVAATGRTMFNIVDGMLDLAAIESGQVRLALGEVDLGHLVAAEVALARRQAARKGVCLSYEAADLPTLVADGPKLRQVVGNLVSNAVKFSPAGSEVRVVVREATDAPAVEVAVSDEGPGISPDDLPHLFEAFRTGSAQPTAGERSTGLGLAIANRLMAAHGGQLQVVSALGQGSTFCMRLPAPARTLTPP